MSSTNDSKERTFQGSCFCGAVKLTVRGEPAAAGYCHCDSCRKWSASPVNAFTLWPPQAVTVTHGRDKLASYAKTANSHRQWCTVCGGHVLTDHPGMGLVDVYAATIPDFPFEPHVHVNYQEAKLRVRDGLPKMKDLPAPMGGSGATLAE